MSLCHERGGAEASMPDGSSATLATPTLVKMPLPPWRSPHFFFCALSAPITNLQPWVRRLRPAKNATISQAVSGGVDAES